MSDLFSDFLEQPSGETYRALREAIVITPSYDPSPKALDDFTRLVETGDHAAVVAALPGLMPNHLLSPRTHLLIAASAERVADTARQEREARMAQSCLRGIRESGAGTQDAPFLCMRVADEYDLAQSLGKTVASQRHEVTDGRRCDVLVCADGSELWFDVTDVLATLAKTGCGSRR